MKRWGLFFLLAVLLIAAGATVNAWLKSLLNFVSDYTNLIQGLADAAQIMIWIAVGIAALAAFLRPNKIPSTNDSIKTPAVHQPVNNDAAVSAVQNQSMTDPRILREAYLSHLFASSRQLSLSGIDPNVASKAETRLHLDGVYTALLTLAPEMHERLERGIIRKKKRAGLLLPRGEGRSQPLARSDVAGGGQSFRRQRLCRVGVGGKFM
jgi:hypothetical protein